MAVREKIAAFWKKETVLCVSLTAALLSFFVTPPGPGTVASIDPNVLMLLFSLMAVVAGLRASGLLARAAELLGRGGATSRSAAAALTGICFFAAMLLTNDVALIAFVPLALAALPGGREKAGTVILMTIAANLGSMVTPIGNPQNLFLSTHFGLGVGEFLGAVWPTAALSALLLAAALLAIPGTPLAGPSGARDSRPLDWTRLLLHGALLLVCLLAVLKALPVWTAFVVVAAACLAMDRAALRSVDWALLATFVCFFVLAGNLSGSAALRSFVENRMTGAGGLYLGAGVSQVISNVPAAVLLSAFAPAGQWRPLLLGVDIGGLGTPVASLASLISLRLYSRSQGAQPGRYLLRFLFWNCVFLIVLLAAARLQLAFF